MGSVRRLRACEFLGYRVTNLRPLLLVDACVLIDYANTSRDALKLVTEHVGELYVTPTVFEEVNQVQPEDAIRWGLKIVELTKAPTRTRLMTVIASKQLGLD
jgi:hypothetical protein